MLKCFFLIYFWCCDIEMNLQSNAMRAFTVIKKIKIQTFKYKKSQSSHIKQRINSTTSFMAPSKLNSLRLFKINHSKNIL